MRRGDEEDTWTRWANESEPAEQAAKEIEYQRERVEGFAKSEEKGRKDEREKKRKEREAEENEAARIKKEADLAERRAVLLAEMKDEPKEGGVTVSAMLGDKRERRR